MSRLRRIAVPRRRLVLYLFGPLLLLAGGLLLASQLPAVRAHALRWAESRLSRALDREVRVEGIALRPWQGRVDLSGLRVAGGRRPADGALLTAERVRLDWSWVALLRRSVVFDRTLLVRPRLAIDAADTATMALLPSILGGAALADDGWTLRVSRIEIEDGRAVWGASGAAARLEGLQGVIERHDRDGATTLEGRLNASRALVPLGGTVREMTHLAVHMEGTEKTLTLLSAEALLGGARVTGAGRIRDPGGAAQLDVRLVVSAPVSALLGSLGPSKENDALLTTDGTLHGPLAGPVFHGTGSVQFPGTPPKHEPVPFAVRWADGRLEIETAHAGRPDTLRARLALDPATGEYRVRLAVQEMDLAALAGFPAFAARLVGVDLPPELGGRLAADVDLAGRGADVTTFRGRGTLRVDDLRVQAGLPAGRLDTRVVATASRLAVESFTLNVPGGTVRGNGQLAFADKRLDLPIHAEIRSVGALGRGFGLPALDGTATLGGRVTGTWDAPRFAGRLSWRDPSIGLYSADRIDGDVEWTPRTLRSSRLVVSLGQTAMSLRGSLAATGEAPLRALDPRRDLVVDVTAEVNPGRIADLVPFLPADLSVRGAFRADGRIAGTANALTGEMALALTDFRTWDEKWQSGTALLRLTPDAVEIDRLSMRRGAERVSGDVRIGHDGAISGRISTTIMDLAGIDSLSGAQVAGRARFVLDLQGTRHDVRILGESAADALLFRDVPLGAATATFTIARKAFDLSLVLRDEGQRIRVARDAPTDPTLRVDIDLTDADPAPLLRLAGIDASSASPARASGRIRMSGPAADFANAAGEATFGALRFQLKGETWENRGPVEVAWQGRTATLRRVHLHSQDRELDVQGTVRDGGQADLQVRGRFPLRAVAGQVPFVRIAGGVGTADLRVRGALGAPEIRGTVDIENGQATLSGVSAPLEEVRGRIDLESGRAFVRRLQGRIAGGRAHATGDVTWQADEWNFRLAFQEEDGRAEQILEGLYPERGEITGALSLDGTFTGRGRADTGFWPNLDGQLKLVMLDGQFGRRTPLVRILSLLNVDFGTAFGPTGQGVSSPGIPYQRLTGDIVVEQGVARTENLFLESRTFHAGAYGQVDLANQTIDMEVAVKPLQALDTLVPKVPAVEWLLRGRDGAVVAAFSRVRGPLSDPTVTPVPLKNVGRNVFGILHRLLKLPEAITGP